MHHLAISDHSGNSVVAEYVDQKLVVTKAPEVTNFLLAQGEKQGIGSKLLQLAKDNTPTMLYFGSQPEAEKF